MAGLTGMLSSHRTSCVWEISHDDVHYIERGPVGECSNIEMAKAESSNAAEEARLCDSVNASAPPNNGRIVSFFRVLQGQRATAYLCKLPTSACRRVDVH